MFAADTSMVSLKTEDQGLAEILKQARVQPEVVKYFTDVCELKSTADFLGFFGQTSFEAEIETLLVKKFLVSEGP